MVTRRHTPKPAPTLTETITTLRDYGTTPEAADLLAITEWVTQSHTAEPHELPNGTFGTCQACRQPWPCATWNETKDLTLTWLIATSTELINQSHQHLKRTAA